MSAFVTCRQLAMLLLLGAGTAVAQKPAVEVHRSMIGGRLSSETTYVGGVRHGPYRYFSTDGYLFEEGLYKNGLKTGGWKTYDARGRVIFLNRYEYGARQGITSIYYYPSKDIPSLQSLSERVPYVCGMKHGRAQEFMPSTQRVSAEGRYDRGRREGTWRFYKTDGTLSKERAYVCGEAAGSPGAARPCPVPSVNLSRPTPPKLKGVRAPPVISDAALVDMCCDAARPLTVYINGKKHLCGEAPKLDLSSEQCGELLHALDEVDDAAFVAMQKFYIREELIIEYQGIRRNLLAQTSYARGNLPTFAHATKGLADLTMSVLGLVPGASTLVGGAHGALNAIVDHVKSGEDFKGLVNDLALDLGIELIKERYQRLGSLLEATNFLLGTVSTGQAWGSNDAQQNDLRETVARQVEHLDAELAKLKTLQDDAAAARAELAELKATLVPEIERRGCRPPPAVVP